MNIRTKLQKHQATIGTWQMIANTSVTEILCQSGFEWITIDLEHTGITVADALDMIRVIDLAGKYPAVRVSENEPTIIKRVLDAGAKIIIVPMVNCREDAEKAVNAIYYPPKGKRGVGLARAQGYGFGFEPYKNNFNNEVVLVVQIEHIDAINNLEDILSVEGVDASIIGPYDLSGSLGHPGEFNTSQFTDALKIYENVSKSMNIPMGYHIVEPDIEIVKAYLDKDYKFIAVGFDTYYLGQICRETMKSINEICNIKET